MGLIIAEKMVADAQAAVGEDYVFGGGHAQFPGPTEIDGRTGMDCSGLMRFIVWRVSGRDLFGPVNARAIFEQGLGGHPTIPMLHPGDLMFIVGDPRDFPPPGHVGMVLTYNPATRQGTYISAYDTQLGTLVEPFVAGSPGWVGATRPWAAIADPVAPPPPAPPKPRPPVMPPVAAAVAWARGHGMVQIDYAEALLALEHGISAYWWPVHASSFSATRVVADIPEGMTLFAYAASLDTFHIPHAGAG